MKRIVIFTAGFHARATFRHLRRQPDCRVVGFVDNNPAARGTSLFDLPILHPRELATLEFDLVAVPGRNQPAILAQLRDELRVDASRIWQVNKSEVPPAPDELARRGADLARLLGQVTTVFDASGIGYWAMHSALLSLMRGSEPALLSDFDLCVEAAAFERLAIELPLHAESGGFTVRCVRAHDEAPWTQISVHGRPLHAADEPAVVDLHPITVGPEEATWPAGNFLFRADSSAFQTQVSRSYRGVAVRVPAEAGSILTQLYGADWHCPTERWTGPSLSARTTALSSPRAPVLQTQAA